MEGKKKLTLKDIALRCDVSTASVSMALSGKGNISKSLRKEIHDVAAQMGYTKNRISKDPTGKTVAILMYINHEWAYLQDFITPIFTQLQVKLTKHNLYPTIIPITNMISNEEIKKSIHSTDVVSIIALHYVNEMLFKELSYEGLPITIINTSSLQKQFYSVCVDDYQGAYD